MRELGQQQQPLRLLAPLRPLACRPPRPPPQIWDLRQEGPTLSLAAHAHEVLAADWCKYNDCIIATGSVDKTIKARAGGDVVCGLEAGQPCYVWNPSIQYPSQLSQLPPARVTHPTAVSVLPPSLPPAGVGRTHAGARGDHAVWAQLRGAAGALQPTRPDARRLVQASVLLCVVEGGWGCCLWCVPPLSLATPPMPACCPPCPHPLTRPCPHPTPAAGAATT